MRILNVVAFEQSQIMTSRDFEHTGRARGPRSTDVIKLYVDFILAAGVTAEHQTHCLEYTHSSEEYRIGIFNLPVSSVYIQNNKRMPHLIIRRTSQIAICKQQP
jgi:hypothetical protein